jgi:hypothetical protein
MTRRILWALNHKTLMPDELSLLRELRFEVFCPRRLPTGVEGRGTRLDMSEERNASLPSDALAVLANHRFYERRWSPTISDIINKYFDVVVTAFYPECYSSAVQNFRGLVIARAFGREGDKTYADLIAGWGVPNLKEAIAALGDRYIFGQAYPELQEIESPPHSKRALTIALPAPSWVKHRIGTWRGTDRRLLFNCPLVNDASYYKQIYDGIKANFGDMPHAIFGRQNGLISDSAVISSASDEEVLDLFASSAAFVYTSTEPRHLHYSPVEAIMVGTPVLYRSGALLDRLSGATLPGASSDIQEMRRKATLLISGDAVLREEILSSQSVLLSSFSRSAALSAWERVLYTKSVGTL